MKSLDKLIIASVLKKSLKIIHSVAIIDFPKFDICEKTRMQNGGVPRAIVLIFAKLNFPGMCCTRNTTSPRRLT